MKRLLYIFLFGFTANGYAQTKSLSYFIDTSLKNNPQLYINNNLILSNSIDSQLIVAGSRIQVNGVSNSFYAPVINGYGYDVAITNGQQLQALVAASKQIYNRRNLNLQFRNLQLQNDSIKIASAITRQDIRKNIITQYIITYGDQLQIDFIDQLIALLSNEEIILKTLTKKNVYKQADYLSFLVTLQQQRLSRSELLVQYKNDFGTLNYLSGIIDTAITLLNDPGINYARNFSFDTSIFIQKFKTDSLQLLNQRTAVDVSYRPKISLFADGGYESSLMMLPYKNFGTSIGINLSIPLYDGHQRQLQYTKINIEERNRIKERDFFKRQLTQQIQQLEQQLISIEGLQGPIKNQIDYLETLISVNGKLLETGDIKITDYVLALNNYTTSKNLLVQNMIARYQVINQLNYWNTGQQ